MTYACNAAISASGLKDKDKDKKDEGQEHVNPGYRAKSTLAGCHITLESATTCISDICACHLGECALPWTLNMKPITIEQRNNPSDSRSADHPSARPQANLSQRRAQSHVSNDQEWYHVIKERREKAFTRHPPPRRRYPVILLVEILVI